MHRTGRGRADSPDPGATLAVLPVEVLLESVELPVPEGPELLDPPRERPQRRRVQGVDHLPAVPALLDQRGLAEDPQMLRDRRKRDPERLRQLAGRPRAVLEQDED